MSGIRLVESGNDLASGIMQISELARCLENRLAACQTIQDLENLISQIKTFTSGSSYAPEEKKILSKIRQRAYDRKRRIPTQASNQPQTSEAVLVREQIQDARSDRPDFDAAGLTTRNQISGNNLEQPKSQRKEGRTNPPQKNRKGHSQEDASMNDSDAKTITTPALQRLIPWGKVATVAPKMLFLIGGSVSIGWLLWLQSVDLYEASGFSAPGLVALGGIFMMAGFAAFHSTFPSKLALVFCLYAGGYEAYFVISGTVSAEASSKTASEYGRSGVAWMQEQLARHKSDYDRVKARYDDPNSKEHKSGWFKKNYVDPKWKLYSASQKKLQSTLAAIESQVEFDHAGLLKILYRLGLVVLHMLFVHQSFRIAAQHSCFHPQ